MTRAGLARSLASPPAATRRLARTSRPRAPAFRPPRCPSGARWRRRGTRRRCRSRRRRQPAEAGERHVRPSVPPRGAHPARRRRLIVPTIVTFADVLQRRVSASLLGRGSSRGRRTGYVRELYARRAAPAAAASSRPDIAPGVIVARGRRETRARVTRTRAIALVGLAHTCVTNENGCVFRGHTDRSRR